MSHIQAVVSKGRQEQSERRILHCRLCPGVVSALTISRTWRFRAGTVWAGAMTRPVTVPMGTGCGAVAWPSASAAATPNRHTMTPVLIAYILGLAGGVSICLGVGQSAIDIGIYTGLDGPSEAASCRLLAVSWSLGGRKLPRCPKLPEMGCLSCLP